MNRLLLLLVCCGFSGFSWCQQENRKTKPESNPFPPIAKAEKASAQQVNVLFATNDDCELYINEVYKGVVLKREFSYLKLHPGNYEYRVICQSTKDELKDSFKILASGPNEIFIDVLYFVDERKAERERLQITSETTRPRFTSSDPFVGDETGTGKLLPGKDAEIATIQSLVANMVLIKGGNFVMGNNRAPASDETEHPVTINPVWFSKYEVTQHQWATIMGYNPSFHKNCATCPVENVSWEEAMKFVRKLNVISQLKFRLPTEAEWEFVARIGGKMEIDTAGGQEEYIRKTAWFFSNSNSETHPVGIRQANAAGIFDLMGNVSEWCLDWYGANYYREDLNRLNPEGPPLGKEKIIRGGNFKDFRGDRFRPSLRNWRNPVEASGEVGFRLVLEAGN